MSASAPAMNTPGVGPGYDRTWMRMDRLRAYQRKVRRRITLAAVAGICGTGYVLVTSALASFTGGLG